MAEIILAANPGSASKKYGLFDGDQELIRVHCERERNGYIATITDRDRSNKITLSPADYENFLPHLSNILSDHKIIRSVDAIKSIGVRVVASGSFFQDHRLVNDRYQQELAQAEERSPLHLKPLVRELESIQKAWSEKPIYGISDSAFYKNLPEYARRYSLPNETAQKFDVYRFGYHGLSMQSIRPKVESLLGSSQAKVIICHLGSGSSIAALQNSQPIDTSMGFSPLEGLPSSTRIGQIDAGAVIYLVKKMGRSLPDLEEFFMKQCGLVGLSSQSDDVRELIELEKSGHDGAKLALEVFIYQIKKYLGSYISALNGLDILVFTGTIGERSSIIRQRVCSQLNVLGIMIDESKNDRTVSRDGLIQTDSSQVKIAVMATNELAEIAHQVRQLNQ